MLSLVSFDKHVYSSLTATQNQLYNLSLTLESSLLSLSNQYPLPTKKQHCLILIYHL